MNTYAEPLKVSFLSPERPENLFWGQVISFAKAVAEDLNIELDIVYPPPASSASSYVMKRMGLQMLNRDSKPDYILTGYWGRPTLDIFEAAKPYDIRFFIFNTAITNPERLGFDKPRGKYANVIGHMYPDDRQGSYALTEILIQKAMEIKNKPEYTVVAISGDTTSNISIERLAGMQKQIERNPNFEIVQIFNTTWTRESAETAANHMLNEYTDTDLLWTVSNDVALGAIQALKADNVHPGKDILVGSFDWSGEGLAAIKNGEMVASMGGHFMEAGWALVLIHDYHNGKDFNIDPGVESVTKMQAITETNVNEYLRLFGDRNWRKIDFRKFSKTLNPDLKKYDFSLNAILANVK